MTQLQDLLNSTNVQSTVFFAGMFVGIMMIALLTILFIQIALFIKNQKVAPMQPESLAPVGSLYDPMDRHRRAQRASSMRREFLSQYSPPGDAFNLDFETSPRVRRSAPVKKKEYSNNVISLDAFRSKKQIVKN